MRHEVGGRWLYSGAFLTCLIAVALCPRETFGQDADCALLTRSLDPLPHQILSLVSGNHVSQYDGKTYSGCQIDFEASGEDLSDDAPDFLRAGEGSELYGQGWRADRTIMADGPGTSLFAIRRGSSLCVVAEGRPAHLEDGEIVVSDTLSITIQCRLE